MKVKLNRNFAFLFLSWVLLLIHINIYFSSIDQVYGGNLKTKTTTSMWPLVARDIIILSERFELYAVSYYNTLIVLDTRTLETLGEYKLGFNLNEDKLLQYKNQILIVGNTVTADNSRMLIILSFDVETHDIHIIGNITAVLPARLKNIFIYNSNLCFISDNNTLIMYSLEERKLFNSNILFSNLIKIAYSSADCTVIAFSYPIANLSFYSLSSMSLIKNITFESDCLPDLTGFSYLEGSNQFSLIIDTYQSDEIKQHLILIFDTEGSIIRNITYDPYTLKLNSISSDVFEFLGEYYFFTYPCMLYKITESPTIFEKVADFGNETMNIWRIIPCESVRKIFVFASVVYVFFPDINTLTPVMYERVGYTYFSASIDTPEIVIVTLGIISFVVLPVVFIRRLKKAK